MKQHINHQIIKDISGSPLFVVVPYQEYLSLISDDAGLVPHEVVSIMVDKDITLTKAWREHLGLTQQEVAAKLNMSQPGYQQIENSENMTAETRKKVAHAFGIKPSQLDLT